MGNKFRDQTDSLRFGVGRLSEGDKESYFDDLNPKLDINAAHAVVDDYQFENVFWFRLHSIVVACFGAENGYGSMISSCRILHRCCRLLCILTVHRWCSVQLKENIFRQLFPIGIIFPVESRALTFIMWVSTRRGHIWKVGLARWDFSM